MVLRQQLNMYCQCTDKCKRPSLCAEKVCATTVEGDFVNGFIGDFDEVITKTLKAETVVVTVPPGTPAPTVEVIPSAPPAAAAALNLPIFGAPFGGYGLGAAPGAVGDAPTVTGSNTAGVMAFADPIAGGTVIKATYGAGGFAPTSTMLVQFFVQNIDLEAEGYSLPSPPQVVASTPTSFSVWFPDSITSGSSSWGYLVTELVASA